MKNWVIFILKINKRLDEIAEFAERRLCRISLMASGNSVSQANKIIEMLEIKRLSVNMRVMYQSMLRALNEDQKKILLLRLLDGKSITTICRIVRWQRKIVESIFESAVDKCILALKECGYTEECLEREYGNARIFKQIRTKMSSAVSF